MRVQSRRDHKLQIRLETTNSNTKMGYEEIWDAICFYDIRPETNLHIPSIDAKIETRQDHTRQDQARPWRPEVTEQSKIM